MQQKEIGAERATWDLTFMYSGIDDPAIEQDLVQLEKLCATFSANYKGKLAQTLGQAITDYSAIKMLSDKILIYLFLQQSLDVTSDAVKAKMAKAQQQANRTQGQHLTFFTLELVELPEDTIENLCLSDEVVKKHKPWIDHQRVFKPHLLSEPVESALIKRSAFGSNAWSEFFDECEADLRFDYQGNKNLSEMLNILSISKDAKERAEVLKLINDGLGKNLAKYAAQTLSIVTHEMAVERQERNYRHPMEAQNKSNNIPDDVVDALHTAVTTVAAPLAQRYYRIKAKLLGQTTLAWSDRNAPLPFSNSDVVPFSQAMDLVLEAYHSFSPTLASIVRQASDQKKIDAPATKGKRGGAFNCSFVMEGEGAQSLTFLNYLGSSRDVMTLAHELGHGVHGILAGQAQGTLMAHAPIAYCETASVFGEMITFNFLKKQLQEKGDRVAMLALLTGKIEDALNTIVRQIGFSNFERRIHGMTADYKTWQEPKKLSVAELNDIWLTTAQELYGKEGDVFTYQDSQYLWSYVSHFQRPFYVYGYAFGELLTQSLYAVQPQFGEKFEPLYLDLLRSGSTKNVVELLQPFGLSAAEPTFWQKGIQVSLGRMIAEAEELAKSL